MAEAPGAPLAARELPSLFARVHAALADRREAIDDLNVFPVPDGDTGTNMTLTVRAGLDALHAARPATPPELAIAVIRGAIRGARGNSGVILSQVLRAVVEVVTGHRHVDAGLYASALRRARDLAYEAVAEPVEGTILTALSVAADAAAAAVARGADLVAASAAACQATAEAVERTRDQLDVLTEAGVVDAGARGFEILLAAVHGHLSGHAPEVRLDPPRRHASAIEDGCHASTLEPFEVQYLLDADDEAAPELRRELEQLGDSVVVVAAGGLLNVHVHTARIGAALEAGLAHGRASDIEVVHLGDQIAARTAARPPAALGAVAVLDGAGAATLARRLGAVVVDGGAGALPSVADLLQAVQRVHAERVLLFPGHRNAVTTAVAAAEVASLESGPTVDVVAGAVTPPAVLAGLAVCDASGVPEVVVAEVRAAADGVRAGEVVGAVKDARTPVGDVTLGQPLAIADGVVVGATATWQQALGALCDALLDGDAELVTMLCGAALSPEECEEAAAFLRARTSAELETVAAGCRGSILWVGVE